MSSCSAASVRLNSMFLHKKVLRLLHRLLLLLEVHTASQLVAAGLRYPFLPVHQPSCRCYAVR
jgi:hypothetical protein